MAKKMWTRAAGTFVASLAFVVLAVNAQVMAQSSLNGDWTASARDESGKANGDNGKIHLNFERRTEKGRRNQMGQSFALTDLQGLSRDQVTNGGPVKFSLVREAGRIDCEGSFQNGKGSGTFTFTGNPSFVASMKSRGFDFEANSNSSDNSEDRLFAATTLNVTTALADDLASAGFGKLQYDDLFKAAIFNVDSKFMREMKDSGFPNLVMEDLVKARIFKIDAEFVKQVVQMGFDKEPFESLVKMRIFKVTPEFISEVRNEGLTDISVEDLVKLRIFKIDSVYMRQAKAEGVPLDVERLVQRKIGADRN